ncbi:hypothetical protein Plhal304r1_c040g0117411 [Plasmopara halstedii]
MPSYCEVGRWVNAAARHLKAMYQTFPLMPGLRQHHLNWKIRYGTALRQT